MPSYSRRPRAPRHSSPLDVLDQALGQDEPSYGNQARAQEVHAQEKERSSGGILDFLFGGGGHEEAPDERPEAAEEVAEAASAWDAVLQGNLTLRIGAKGPAVERLQALLNEHGAKLTADGDFGRGTRRAVIAFQNANGLVADGVVGKGTAAAFSGAPAKAEPTPEQGPVDPEQEERQSQQAQAPKRAKKGKQRWVEGEPPVINVSPGDFVRQGLTAEVLSVALTVFKNAWMAGKTKKMIYTVIDYSRPRRDKRLFVLDLEAGKLLFAEHVQDGAGKDRGADLLAHSNERGSGESSVGLSKTGGVGYGPKYGKHLTLHGLEEGFNDNMEARAVVMHGWGKASQEAYERDGSVYLSQGCPAMDPRVAGKVIDTVKGGSLVFSYFPDEKYLRESKFTH